MKKDKKFYNNINAWGNKYQQAGRKERIDLIKKDVATYRAYRVTKQIDWGIFWKRFFAKLIDLDA